ncbi:Hypothetical protein CINCED_3A009633 [Cinara cedri]|uniref:Uncharacterized protein n=1 Tax=Cinara cedri TaxID=506608 RepID=A0A5E4NFP2_9HEMI|nr:Hypothetical protein CINCED_3A009633 [Cinara cedri]
MNYCGPRLQQSLIPDVQKLIPDNDVSVTSLGWNAVTRMEQYEDFWYNNRLETEKANTADGRATFLGE